MISGAKLDLFTDLNTAHRLANALSEFARPQGHAERVVGKRSEQIVKCHQYPLPMATSVHGSRMGSIVGDVLTSVKP